jgi:DNA-binding CsgD family transcriptional regulator
VQGHSSPFDEAHTTTLESAAECAVLGIEALNALGTGIAILDARAQILLANATAARILAHGCIFRTSSPLSVSLHDARSNEAFRKALSAAGLGTSAALQLRDRRATAVVSAILLPLPRSPDYARRRSPMVLLAMNELIRSEEIPHRWLAQMFGLTRAESSITSWLVSGRSIDEYAQYRGISLETARSQLKTVLSKTGMSRQAQLVAALARLPVDCTSG